MPYSPTGTAEGQGANPAAAAKDSFTKAVDQAVDSAQVSVLSDPLPDGTMHEGVEDSDPFWDDAYVSYTLTIEKSEPTAAAAAGNPPTPDKAKTGWRASFAKHNGLPNKPADLPAKHTQFVNPGGAAPNLCTDVFWRDGGKFRTTVDKPFAIGKATGEALDKAKAEIAATACPAKCADLRATVYASHQLVGETSTPAPGRATYTVHWYLRLYCFDEANERK